MRVKFLFWNVRKGAGTQLAISLTRLADAGVDVFLLAEAPDDITRVVAALNATTAGLFAEVAARSRRIRILTRLHGPLESAQWTERFFDAVSDRLTAFTVQPLGTLNFLLVAAHLKSPSTGISREGLAEWARDVARDIARIEDDSGITRTVLVGDLNMSPFDLGLVNANALHAVMSRQLARVVATHSVRSGARVFYNPMWSCYGDRPTRAIRTGTRPPGTHYYAQNDDPTNEFWRMYDQVLLRPEMMNKLVHLEILGHDGTESLVTKDGRPRTATKSDHLPVQFELDL